MKLNIVLLASCCSLLFNSCGSLNVPIEKNKTENNTSFTFSEQNFTVNAGDFFSLSEKGLRANTKKIMIASSADMSKVIIYMQKQFKKGNFIFYNITIKNPRYAKPYYGKIAFFNTNKKNQLEAVSRYREIEISDSYFQSATRGRVALMYEYFKSRLVQTTVQVPTWVILMSDEPL